MIQALLDLARLAIVLGLMVVFAWAFSILLYPKRR